MNEPKFNFVFWVPFLLGVEGFIFAVFTYYSIEFPWLLSGLLVGILMCVTGLLINFYINFKNYYKTTKDISDRHEALANEFDSKNILLDTYEQSFFHFGQIMIFAMGNLGSNEKRQIENLFRVYTIYKENISGVKKNE